jgi:hypothetical protein
MRLEISWAELKRLADSKLLPVQWVDAGDRYYIAIVDGAFGLYTVLDKGDASEFETSYKSSGNRRITTAPAALPDPDNFRFRGDATAWATCAPGATNLDYVVTEERHVDGGVVIVKDANPGDYCIFQVVHPQAGVVEQFVNKWFVIPGTGKMDVNVYRARVPAGLTIRIVYNNVGATNVACGINLRLHKLGA